MQALVDTRTEVERWADRSIEFHFANILSPWIKRALISCGFGTGVPSARLPTEVAAVVPYRKYGDLRHGENPQGNQFSGRVDEETGVIQQKDIGSSTPSNLHTNATVDEHGALTSHATPFFHFDLASAVRAAELGTTAKYQTSSQEKDRSSVVTDDADYVYKN